ncbi:uncharacterized protein N7483_004074 [Penicillium malachiteum]|uniref:uncharacterized protein n=1 Tax=Penicillium malachiteum TaxID=1324776 RepID=UPI00254755FE|nr:uncharacterized protein N7483_004074 [Penicillium malachiteum]KAJ5729566.1 hypothetical protein N7483_004074 [Penicillium malachiteum]
MTEPKLLYKNTLESESDVADWIPEGPVKVKSVTTDDKNSIELSSAGDLNDHFTFWCPEKFPSKIRIKWEFSPIFEPGLAMLFFGAAPAAPESGDSSIFSPSLAHRDGAYPQYHSSDIRTLHISYFRRRWENERAFHTCNLRKSPGFHLVAQGADPLPPVEDARGAFYRIEVIKDDQKIRFSINDLPLFEWVDDDGKTGPVVGDGAIGFRQMAPLVAQYRNLEVWEL